MLFGDEAYAIQTGLFRGHNKVDSVAQVRLILRSRMLFFQIRNAVFDSATSDA